MLGASGDAGQRQEGPDYFSYYVQALAELMSEDDKTVNDRSLTVSNLFDNCIGAGMSDYKKGRLHVLLRQGVQDLTAEVDEMLDPVLRMRELRCRLKRTDSGARTDDARKGPKKKRRMTATASSSFLLDSSTRVDDDYQFLQQTDAQVVDDITKKYSDELSSMLKTMEMKLEELLDSLAFKCRPMMPFEKQILQKLVKESPQENLSRVADIFQQSGKKEASDGKLFVNLDMEENRTLWRVYFYLRAIKNAKMAT